jgi:IS5 family transposase
MVRRAYRQRSLVEVLLPDAEKLWDPALRQIDAVLDDDALVDRVAEALARRHPESRRRGRLGTPAAVVLRMLVLKHLNDWSFDECEREVRGSLVYRAFCRIDGERVPDAKTLIRLAHLLDGPVLKELLARLVAIGRARRVVRGRRLRVDTTVVETNIHYPTDSTLLVDGVRVLTRTMKRIRQRLTGVRVHVRDRTRSARRRLFGILQRTRTASLRSAQEVRAQSKARIKQLYQRLLGITRATVRDAETVAHQVTRARSTGVRRAQFITDYTVCPSRVPDRTLWLPSLERHEHLFGHPPLRYPGPRRERNELGLRGYSSIRRRDIARSHFFSWSSPKTRASSGGAVTQPPRLISSSSWPGPHPA